MEKKLISIITPVYNGGKTIVDCLKSVEQQSYKNIEHVIIDGGSTDDTLVKLNKFNVLINSEPDNGIYDAMNKGIRKSTGDIIGILNSDDLYYDDGVIERIVNAFSENDCNVVYGNIVCVAKYNISKILRDYKSECYSEDMFVNGSHPPHPSFFVKRVVYEKYGFFNLKYKIAADYEFMLRILKKMKLDSFYLDDYIVKMRVGGASNSSVKAIIRSNQECKQAWIDNGLKVPFGLVFKKPISKIKQIVIS